MPYIQRNAAGKIVGIFANEQDYAQELIADTAQELLDFLNPASVVPQSVTPLQARQALLASNLLDAVNAAVAGADAATKLAWEYATAVERNSPFTKTLATALNLTDAQVDALFIKAATFT